MDPHYHDSELWCFSDGIRPLYRNMDSQNLNYVAPLLKQLNGSFMELHNSAKVKEIHDSLMELDNTIV